MTTITIDRATVEQALEILEKLVVGSDYEEAVEAEQAMESFRAALAQQAEPVCKCDLRTRLVGDGCEVCNPGLAAELAQQGEPGKPVGWNWMLDGQPYGQAYYGNPPDTDIAERAAIAGRTVRLLYTAPPQRKPLTEEEIDRIDACIDKFTPLREGKRLFARAVERAHGITGDCK